MHAVTKNLELRYIPSFKCIGNCPFCHKEGLSCEEDTDLGRIAKLSKSFKEKGFKKITIAGGEPLPWENLLKVINIFNKDEFDLKLTVSGMGLTPDLLSHLPQFTRRIHLSVPSFDPDRYYYYSGVEFTNFERLIEKIIELGINIRLNYTVTQDEVIYWKKALKFAIEKQLNLCIQDIVWHSGIADIYEQSFINVLHLVKKIQGLYWRIKEGYTPKLIAYKGNTLLEVKSAELSRIQRYDVCDYCEYDTVCSERICSLRIYPSGKLGICLEGPKDLCWAESTEDPEKAIHRLLLTVRR